MLNIESIKKQYQEILQQLSSPELLSDWPSSASAKGGSASGRKATAGKEKFEQLLKEKNRLEKIVSKYDELLELKNRIEENKEIIKAREDAELNSLSQREIEQLQ